MTAHLDSSRHLDRRGPASVKRGYTHHHSKIHGVRSHILNYSFNYRNVSVTTVLSYNPTGVGIHVPDYFHNFRKLQCTFNSFGILLRNCILPFCQRPAIYSKNACDYYHLQLTLCRVANFGQLAFVRFSHTCTRIYM